MTAKTINVCQASYLLREIADATDAGQITVSEFISLLGNRSFALAILIFALPNAFPLGLPGLSTITGIPIIFIALQLVWGRKTIWLPRRIADKTFSHYSLRTAMGKAYPVVQWFEKFLHPRITGICESKIGERSIAAVIALMALLLILPVVGLNLLPGICISLLALALLEKDGALATFSLLLCVMSSYVMYEMIVLVTGRALDWIGL